MNQHQHRLLDVTHALTRLPSRRDALRGLAATALGFGSRATDAKKRKKRKRNKNKKQKVTFNAFGCVDIESFCQNDEQCCSGICEGKKAKRRCQAHDQTTCQPGQREYFCGGIETNCTTSAGAAGYCNTTTGNAGYCSTANAGVCAACTKDADCQALCGPQAACIACADCEETGGVGCVGPEVEGCVDM